MTGFYTGLVSMETIPITEAKARIAELADRVAREHDHFTITRNGRADVMLISVAEYESMQETLDILSDEEALADLLHRLTSPACTSLPQSGTPTG